MNILINIPIEDINDMVTSGYCNVHRLMDIIHKGKKFADNATNGDVIKIIFSDYTFFEDSKYGDKILMEKQSPYCRLRFDRDWWNKNRS